MLLPPRPLAQFCKDKRPLLWHDLTILFGFSHINPPQFWFSLSHDQNSDNVTKITQLWSIFFFKLLCPRSHDFVRFISFIVIHFLQPAREFMFFYKTRKWYFVKSKYISDNHFSSSIIQKNISCYIKGKNISSCIKAPMISWDLSVFMTYIVPIISWDLRQKRVKRMLTRFAEFRSWKWEHRF